MDRVILFGLGSMGFGIGQSLIGAGLTVNGYDLDEGTINRFRDAGGAMEPLEEAIGQARIVIIVVVNAAQTENVLFGHEGIAGRLAENSVVISCATVPPEFARQMEARVAEHGVHYLDAPISGGAKKSAEGKLTIMASGSADAFETATPALDAMAETVFPLGSEAGPGSAMKIVNQLMAGVHIAAAAEAITFGMTQGVLPAQCVEVISQCAGTSWMFENRGPHIVDGDYTPYSAVEIFVKDLGIVSDIARSKRFSTPLAGAALHQFLAASAMGFGLEDDSAVAKVYARNGGLTLPQGET